MPCHGARFGNSCAEKYTHPRPDFINTVSGVTTVEFQLSEEIFSIDPS